MPRHVASDEDRAPPRSALRTIGAALQQSQSPPLGATLGDTLTTPRADGGFNLGRFTSSLVIAVAMIVLVLMTSLRHAAPREPAAERG